GEQLAQARRGGLRACRRDVVGRHRARDVEYERDVDTAALDGLVGLPPLRAGERRRERDDGAEEERVAEAAGRRPRAAAEGARSAVRLVRLAAAPGGAQHGPAGGHEHEEREQARGFAEAEGAEV